MMMEGLPTERLLLRPRPKLREIRALAESVDTVVVLLMEREDVAPLLGAWQATGVEVIHVDWGLRRDGDEAVRDCAGQVASRLRSGRRVLIHCAAGMHRTGRVAYESLRLLGFDRDEAVAEIRRIRPVTADAVERVLAGTTATSSLAGDRIESFWGEYRFLSNLNLIDVRFDGRTYPSVEHAYQAAKSADDSVRASIAAIAAPGDAKRAGAQIEVTADWTDERRLEVMAGLVATKFTDPGLARRLLATGEAFLVEGNEWGDRFWGTVDGRGHNHLGRILMEVHRRLRSP